MMVNPAVPFIPFISILAIRCPTKTDRPDQTANNREGRPKEDPPDHLEAISIGIGANLADNSAYEAYCEIKDD